MHTIAYEEKEEIMNTSTFTSDHVQRFFFLSPSSSPCFPLFFSSVLLPIEIVCVCACVCVHTHAR